MIDNLARALDRAVENGVKELYVQPTHLMDGKEYNDVLTELAGYADKFEKIVVGAPILTGDEDYDAVIKAITEATAAYAADEKTAVVFMGHGTEAESNHVYADMQAKLTAAGYANYFVGTVEAKPDVYDVLEAVKAGGFEKVVLRPLMIVAGDHANNDMADLEDPESWASIFKAAGFEVECVLEGLGQLPAIQSLLVDHMKAAMEAAEAPEEEDEENYETGDASLDDPRNADEIGEKELLVVSFGTSFNDSRRLTIGAIEKAMEEAFPELSVRRGFTAQIVIDHIQKRDGEVIDNFGQALDRAVANGVKELYVQPTHLMDGKEYNDVLTELAGYADKFEKIVVGAPILTGDEDYDAVIKAITEATAAYAADEKTAVVFMGHGTEAESNHVYADMQAKLTAAGYANYFVGTVEAEPDVYDVLEAVKAGGFEKVVLRPLMIVAGDHANNDMADLEDPESWASIFKTAGFEVECVLEGLGQLPAIQNLLVDHMKAAMEAAEAPEEEEDEENYETGDASLDDPRNQDEIGEKELLVVSFGTSYNDSRRLTIGAIEKAMEDAKPGYAVRRAFTAQIVIDHIQKRDGEVIDNLTQALTRAIANGVKYLVVQPTHLMDGKEYNDVKNELLDYVDKFDSIKLGKPVLTTDEDYDAVIAAITDATAAYAADPKTAIVFMGHGTEADSNHVYADMQAKLTAKGYANYFVGTVEAKPDVYDVLEAVKAGDYEKVVLRPLMIVAGDHANNDMADLEDPESWASIFKAAGFDVECVLEGLGQLEPIQKLLVDHARDAQVLVPTREVVEGDNESVDKGATPVTGDMLNDGTYEITVNTGAGMFKIQKAELTVLEGKMTAKLYFNGSAYSWFFVGAGDKIADAALEDFIPAEPEGEGYTFEIDVEALDQVILCASYSKNKDQWYTRNILFDAATLPEGALK